MRSPLHPIKTVVQRTGLTAHVIRIWERRYGVVEPTRTATNRRVYSDADIERLTLLRELTTQGHSIGNLAAISTAQLKRIWTEANGAQHAVSPPRHDDFVSRALSAIERLDPAGLAQALSDAETALGMQGVLIRVAAPLAQQLGERWRDGSLTAAHEHFASGILRTFLSHAARPFGGSENAPLIAIATPDRQLHELGALMAAAHAATLGWRVVYLGASLPAAEIAGAAQQQKAKVVALSLVYPLDDAQLSSELDKLRSLLPASTALVVGGRAAPAYHVALQQIGAVVTASLEEFGRVLDRVRAAGPK